MPLVEVTLGEGRTPDQIRSLLSAVTEAVHTSIGAPVANIRVVVREVPLTHWSAGGVTLAERQAAAATPSPDANSPETKEKPTP